MSRLRLSLLGPPLVTVDGRSVDLKPRKSLALLVYLAVSAAPHGRDALAELLFPALDRERSRAGVRQSLSILRRAVGEDWVRADADRIWLNHGRGLWMDTRELRRLIEESSKAERAGDAPGAMKLWSEAERLFRGEFMAGFFLKDSSGFESWQMSKAEDLRREHGRLLAKLVASLQVSGEEEKAIAASHRWLSLDPADEAAHRALMRLYATTGRRAEALRQFARCQDILRRELDSAPDAETEELRGAISEGRKVPGRSAPEPSPTTARRGNLREEITTFIGRERELAEVVGTLRRNSVRILTLTGPGGTGKTRLALEAARIVQGSFAQGVFFVDLAVLSRPSQVLPAIAAALRLHDAARDERSLLELLKGHLGGRELLLLLDNCEHVLAAAVHIADLAATCPRLEVLATSRESLGVRGEFELPVPPLRLPEAGLSFALLGENEAVRLFAERAASVQPGFDVTEENATAIRQICVRLDGLPLALELAAARVKAFPPSTLLGLLDRRLDLLRGGARDLPERQRTLRGEIDWSFALLDPGERQLFCRLSVFPGGCTIESAASVWLDTLDASTAAESLESLANKSLLKRADVRGRSRFHMLETIREYAGGRLMEAGEAEATRDRFSLYFLGLAEKAEPYLCGANQDEWLDLLDAEHDNIAAAMSWLHDRSRHEELLRLAGAMGWFWYRRARFRDGYHWLALARSGSSGTENPSCRARAAYGLALIVEAMKEDVYLNQELGTCLEESLRLYRLAGDHRGTALAQVFSGFREAILRAPQVHREGLALMDGAVEVARSTGDPWAISMCLKVAYAYLYRDSPAPDVRRAALEESITLARKTQDLFLVRETVKGMGDLLLGLGQPEAAIGWFEEALEVAREIESRTSIFDTLFSLGNAHRKLGDLPRAGAVLREGLRIAADCEARGSVPFFLGLLRSVAVEEGQKGRAARLWASESSLLDPARVEPPPDLVETLGMEESAALAAWKLGNSMSFDEIVRYALSYE